MKTRKEFIMLAIENGYTGKNCEGWDWIKENLSMLDYIFQTDEYKTCNGMQYKCMPFVSGNDTFTEEEIAVLSTAWYLNNEKKDKKRKTEYNEKMLLGGWLPLSTELVQKALDEGKKVELNATSQTDWMAIKVNKILKPHKFGDRYGLMPLKARTRGYLLNQFDNAYIKLI